MKKICVLIFTFIVVLTVGCGQSLTEKAQPVVQQATAAINQATGSAQKPSYITGKVMVWDGTQNRLHGANDRLPEGLKWTGDGPVTIFSIIHIDDKQVGQYEKGSIAYKSTVTMAVAYYPQNIPGGKMAIVGNDPPHTISYKRSPPAFVRGDLNQPIVDWIQGLPRR